jgi:hypothetical protein
MVQRRASWASRHNQTGFSIFLLKCSMLPAIRPGTPPAWTGLRCGLDGRGSAAGQCTAAAGLLDVAAPHMSHAHERLLLPCAHNKTANTREWLLLPCVHEQNRKQKNFNSVTTSFSTYLCLCLCLRCAWHVKEDYTRMINRWIKSQRGTGFRRSHLTSPHATQASWRRRRGGRAASPRGSMYLPREGDGVLELVGGIAEPRRQRHHPPQPPLLSVASTDRSPTSPTSSGTSSRLRGGGSSSGPLVRGAPRSNGEANYCSKHTGTYSKTSKKNTSISRNKDKWVKYYNFTTMQE